MIKQLMLIGTWVIVVLYFLLLGVYGFSEGMDYLHEEDKRDERNTETGNDKQ